MMQKEGNIKLRICLLTLLSILALAPSLALATLQVGNLAPDFTLPDTAWVNHQLTEYRGKVVLLMFWQST